MIEVNKEKLEVYLKSLKSPYTGMTVELALKINATSKEDLLKGVLKQPEIDMDLNKDGKFDEKDASIAGKVLRKTKGE